MNKTSIIAVVFGVLVLGGVGALLVTSSDDDSSNSASNANNSEDTISVNNNVGGPQGTYTDYNEANFAAASEQDKVIFFHAAWCVVCKSIENNIMASSIPENLAILEADFDEDDDLRKRHGVTQQTTFVHVDNDGNEIKKWVMFDSSAGIDEIVAEIESA